MSNEMTYRERRDVRPEKKELLMAASLLLFKFLLDQCRSSCTEQIVCLAVKAKKACASHNHKLWYNRDHRTGTEVPGCVTATRWVVRSANWSAVSYQSKR
jgi:hypothetical protein